MNAWFDEAIVRFYFDDSKKGVITSSGKHDTCVQFDDPVELIDQDELKDLLRACQMATKAYSSADDSVETIEESD